MRARVRAVAAACQGGVTLIEVLIAVVVLSIGLLGIANLHMAGLRFTHDAYLTSQASVMSQDIIDRMRANRRAARDDAYADSDLGEHLPEVCGPITLSGSVARRDIAQWKLALACNLPNGDGAIVRQSGDVFRIIVQWDSPDSDNPRQTLVTEVRL